MILIAARNFEDVEIIELLRRVRRDEINPKEYG